MKFVKDAVDDGNVTVDWIDGAFLVEEDGVAFGLTDRQLVVVYIRQRELCIRFSVCNGGNHIDCVSLRLHVTAIDDSVLYDYLTYRVELPFICKRIP